MEGVFDDSFIEYRATQGMFLLGVCYAYPVARLYLRHLLCLLFDMCCELRGCNGVVFDIHCMYKYMR